MGRRLSRAVATAKKVRAWAATPRVRPWLLAVGFVLFVAMIYQSVRQLDGDWDSIEPLLLVVLVFAGPPLALPLNAVEYQTMARMLGHEVHFYDGIKISVAAALANYLPAPGGVAVRTAALKGRGSTIGSAVSANAIAGVLWLGIALVATGFSLLVASELTGRGTIALAAGLAAVAASAAWARRGRSNWQHDFRRLLLVEVGLVLLNGIRVWIALIAIGQPANIGAAVAISSALVVAAAIGIFPGGLGIREALGGAIAVAVDVPIAAAVLALSVNRVTGLTGMGLSAAVIGLRREQGASPDGSPAESDHGGGVDEEPEQPRRNLSGAVPGFGSLPDADSPHRAHGEVAPGQPEAASRRPGQGAL